MVGGDRARPLWALLVRVRAAHHAQQAEQPDDGSPHRSAQPLSCGSRPEASDARAGRASSRAQPFRLCLCGCGGRAPIARQTNTAAGWVRGKPIPYIQGHGLRPLTAEQEDEACRRYQEDGQNCREIGEALGASRKAVAAVLERRGIARDFSTRAWTEERRAIRRTCDCDHSFFDVIDTEAKAYWLGFLAADGCNTAGFLSVSCASKDHEHLLRFRADLSSGHPVHKRANKRGGQSFGKGVGYISSFAIRSSRLTAGLAAHGVTPRKTFTLQ